MLSLCRWTRPPALQQGYLAFHCPIATGAGSPEGRTGKQVLAAKGIRVARLLAFAATPGVHRIRSAIIITVIFIPASDTYKIPL